MIIQIGLSFKLFMTYYVFLRVEIAIPCSYWKRLETVLDSATLNPMLCWRICPTIHFPMLRLIWRGTKVIADSKKGASTLRFFAETDNFGSFNTF